MGNKQEKCDAATVVGGALMVLGGPVGIVAGAATMIGASAAKVDSITSCASLGLDPTRQYVVVKQQEQENRQSRQGH